MAATERRDATAVHGEIDPAFARSLLFVPGDHPQRFDKAANSGADAVIVDLEDAVAPASKRLALEHLLAWLELGRTPIVRVNGVGTPWHIDEIAALRNREVVIMVPKAESAEQLGDVMARLGPSGRIIALIETARGIQDADGVCSVEGVLRVALGNVDLATQLGVDPASHPALAYSRGRLIAACAAAGLVAPIDGVTTALDLPAVLAADLAVSRELGFSGKLCLHPRQVEPVNLALKPSADEIAWAQRVLASFGEGGVSKLDGRMIDAPVAGRARRLLAQASNAMPR